MKILNVLFFLVFAMLTHPALATDYYVDAQNPSASDSNPGTQQSPWRTIGRANDISQTLLMPGDVVWINGGSVSYQEEIIPRRSGTSGAPITFEGYGVATPVVIPVNNESCIHFHSAAPVQHVVIDNIECLDSAGSPDFAGYVLVQNASFVEIRNSFFTGGNNWIEFQSGSRNKLVNNEIVPDSTCSADQDGTGQLCATAIIIQPSSPYNLIQDNDILDGGHDNLAVRSSYNVIRGNLFENPNWRQVAIFPNCSPASPSPPQGASCPDPAERNVFELNRVRGSSSSFPTIQNSLQLKSPRTIIRRNLFYDNTGSGLRLNREAPPTTATDLRDNRIYHNVFYENGSDGNFTVGLSIRVDNYAGNANGNVLLNNVFFRNDGPGGTLQISLGGNSMSGLEGTVIKNNDILYQTSGANVIELGYPSSSYPPPNCDGTSSPPASPLTKAAFESCYPSLVSGNLEVDPQFVDTGLDMVEENDFTIPGSSPLRNAGAFMTQTTSSGTGTAVPVGDGDASYFFDGYGITGVTGDRIKIGTKTRTITSVDYVNDVLTVSQSLTWTLGQNVHLSYAEANPDIGADEFVPGGCGLGWELTAILPLLRRVRRLRRRGQRL